MDEAEDRARQFISLQERVVGDRDAEYASGLSLLADVLIAKSELADAEPLVQRALDIRKKTLGSDHAEYADSLTQLGRLLLLWEDFEAAEPLFQQALEIRARHYGVAHPKRAESLTDLAKLARRRERPADALPLLIESLEILKEASGDHSAALAKIYSMSAEAQLHGDQLDSAEASLRQAIDLYRANGQERDPAYLEALENQARLLERKGLLDEAEPAWRLVLDMKKQALGEKHLECGKVASHLGQLLLRRGEAVLAETMCREATEAFLSSLGERHPDYASSLMQLGFCSQRNGDLAAAETHLRQALAIRKDVLGPKHSDYVSSLMHLAQLVQKRGDGGWAKMLLKEAVEVRESVLGEHHTDYAQALSSLADVLAQQGEATRAEALLRQALTIREQAEGTDTPAFASCLSSLAAIVRKRGDLDSAEELLRESLEIRKRTLGEHNQDYVVGLGNLAWLLQNRGDSLGAEQVLEEALKIRGVLQGVSHPDYKQTVDRLERIRRRHGLRPSAQPAPPTEPPAPAETQTLPEERVPASIENLSHATHMPPAPCCDDGEAVTELPPPESIVQEYAGHDPLTLRLDSTKEAPASALSISEETRAEDASEDEPTLVPSQPELVFEESREREEARILDDSPHESLDASEGERDEEAESEVLEASLEPAEDGSLPDHLGLDRPPEAEEIEAKSPVEPLPSWSTITSIFARRHPAFGREVEELEAGTTSRPLEGAPISRDAEPALPADPVPAKAEASTEEGEAIRVEPAEIDAQSGLVSTSENEVGIVAQEESEPADSEEFEPTIPESARVALNFLAEPVQDERKDSPAADFAWWLGVSAKLPDTQAPCPTDQFSVSNRLAKSLPDDPMHGPAPLEAPGLVPRSWEGLVPGEATWSDDSPGKDSSDDDSVRGAEPTAADDPDHAGASFHEPEARRTEHDQEVPGAAEPESSAMDSSPLDQEAARLEASDHLAASFEPKPSIEASVVPNEHSAKTEPQTPFRSHSMSQSSNELSQEFASLSDRFSEMGERMLTAARQLHAPGAPPSQALIDEIDGCRRDFLSLRERTIDLAQSFGLSTPVAENLTSLQGMNGLLDQVAEAEIRRSKGEETRRRAVALLDRVLSMKHTGAPDFEPLRTCQDKARELRDAIRGNEWSEMPEEAERIAEGDHHFADLLTLIEDRDELADDHWAALHENVGNVFGKALAAAAARNKLVVTASPSSDGAEANAEAMAGS